MGLVQIEQWERRRLAAGGAGVAVAGLAYWLGVWTVAGQRAEDRIVADAYALRAVTGWRPEVLPVDPSTAAGLAVLVLVAVGLARRRLAGAVVAIGLLVGAAGAGWVPKSLLPRPRLDRVGQATANSFPSGHVVLVMSIVLAVLLVTPAALRWLVAALGAIAASWVVSATLIAAWHRPSDAVGADAVCFALFVVATTIAHRRGWLGARESAPLGVAATVFGGFGCLVVAVIGTVTLQLPVAGARSTELLLASVGAESATVAVVVCAMLLLRSVDLVRTVPAPVLALAVGNRCNGAGPDYVYKA